MTGKKVVVTSDISGHRLHSYKRFVEFLFCIEFIVLVLCL